MALHSEGSYQDVMAQLTDGLAWSSGWAEQYMTPSKSGIFQARARLGPEPVEALFRRVAKSLAEPGAAGRRLVAIDGTCLDVPDTAANEAHFGRAGSIQDTRAAFPLARVVAVAECVTHAILDAEVGPYTKSETEMAGPLLDRLGPGMLVLADRGVAGLALRARAVVTGADLLWRFQNGTGALTPHPLRELPDGSWLARITPTRAARRRSTAPLPEQLTVRVIDYTVEDGRKNPQAYRLLTTLTDPEQAPAEQLALAYAQRWEIEIAFDELKTHQRGPRAVLRSISPELVYQEIWGHLCCNYAIRTLMADTAQTSGRNPDRISFVAALRITRRSLEHQGDFSPSAP